MPVPGAIRALLDGRGPYLVPLLLLLLTRLYTWRNLPLASEDAYITFRFARNLAAGHGLVYNPGEKVMGFTSLLWTLWCSLGDVTMHDPVAWSRATSLLADVVALLAMTRLLERHAGRTAAFCFAFFYAVWPYFSAATVSGMENVAMVGLIALGASLIGRRSPAAGPALGLLALLRPEGIASATVLSLGARGRDRLVALALVAAGVAALVLLYGSPVPQSVIAKSNLYGTPGPWQGRFWWSWIVPVTLGAWPTIGDLSLALPLTVLWSAAAFAALPPLWRARRSPLALAIGACLVVWAAYALLGVAYFYWYLAVPLAGLAALGAAGIPRVTRGRAVLVALALSVASSWSIAFKLYGGRAGAELEFARVSAEIHERCRPGEKVMLEPIGIIGFQNPLVVIDEVGLVTPRVAERRLRGPGWYADIAAVERPEWLVVRRGFLTQRVDSAFAGRGAPFRDTAERDSTLAPYRELPDQPATSDQSLVILRRRT